MKIRKSDIILIAAILLLALGVLLYSVLPGKNGASVTVSVNGIKTATYSLGIDREVTIHGYRDGVNVLKISDGKAAVIEASCPDGICVSMREIYRNGESIICLPNRVVVTVNNGEYSDLDVF